MAEQEDVKVIKHTTWWGEEIDVLELPDGSYGIPMSKPTEIWMPKHLEEFAREYYLVGSRINDSQK
jgi:hypothetical protein